MDADGSLMEQPSGWDVHHQRILAFISGFNLGPLMEQPSGWDVHHQRILVFISGFNPGPLMDADGAPAAIARSSRRLSPAAAR
jgi:hypothetical protein